MSIDRPQKSKSSSEEKSNKNDESSSSSRSEKSKRLSFMIEDSDGEMQAENINVHSKVLKASPRSSAATSKPTESVTPKSHTTGYSYLTNTRGSFVSEIPQEVKERSLHLQERQVEFDGIDPYSLLGYFSFPFNVIKSVYTPDRKLQRPAPTKDDSATINSISKVYDQNEHLETNGSKTNLYKAYSNVVYMNTEVDGSVTSSHKSYLDSVLFPSMSDISTHSDEILEDNSTEESSKDEPLENDIYSVVPPVEQTNSTYNTVSNTVMSLVGSSRYNRMNSISKTIINGQLSNYPISGEEESTAVTIFRVNNVEIPDSNSSLQYQTVSTSAGHPPDTANPENSRVSTKSSNSSANTLHRNEAMHSLSAENIRDSLILNREVLHTQNSNVFDDENQSFDSIKQGGQTLLVPGLLLMSNSDQSKKSKDISINDNSRVEREDPAYEVNIKEDCHVMSINVTEMPFADADKKDSTSTKKSSHDSRKPPISVKLSSKDKPNKRKSKDSVGSKQKLNFLHHFSFAKRSSSNSNEVSVDSQQSKKATQTGESLLINGFQNESTKSECFPTDELCMPPQSTFTMPVYFISTNESNSGSQETKMSKKLKSSTTSNSKQSTTTSTPADDMNVPSQGGIPSNIVSANQSNVVPVDGQQSMRATQTGESLINPGSKTSSAKRTQEETDEIFVSQFVTPMPVNILSTNETNSNSQKSKQSIKTDDASTKKSLHNSSILGSQNYVLSQPATPLLVYTVTVNNSNPGSRITNKTTESKSSTTNVSHKTSTKSTQADEIFGSSQCDVPVYTVSTNESKSDSQKSKKSGNTDKSSTSNISHKTSTKSTQADEIFGSSQCDVPVYTVSTNESKSDSQKSKKSGNTDQSSTSNICHKTSTKSTQADEIFGASQSSIQVYTVSTNESKSDSQKSKESGNTDKSSTSNISHKTSTKSTQADEIFGASQSSIQVYTVSTNESKSDSQKSKESGNTDKSSTSNICHKTSTKSTQADDLYVASQNGMAIPIQSSSNKSNVESLKSTSKRFGSKKSSMSENSKKNISPQLSTKSIQADDVYVAALSGIPIYTVSSTVLKSDSMKSENPSSTNISLKTSTKSTQVDEMLTSLKYEMPGSIRSTNTSNSDSQNKKSTNTGESSTNISPQRTSRQDDVMSQYEYTVYIKSAEESNSVSQESKESTKTDKSTTAMSAQDDEMCALSHTSAPTSVYVASTKESNSGFQKSKKSSETYELSAVNSLPNELTKSTQVPSHCSTVQNVSAKEPNPDERDQLSNPRTSWQESPASGKIAEPINEDNIDFVTSNQGERRSVASGVNSDDEKSKRPSQDLSAGTSSFNAGFNSIRKSSKSHSLCENPGDSLLPKENNCVPENILKQGTDSSDNTHQQWQQDVVKYLTTSQSKDPLDVAVRLSESNEDVVLGDKSSSQMPAPSEMLKKYSSGSSESNQSEPIGSVMLGSINDGSGEILTASQSQSPSDPSELRSCERERSSGIRTAESIAETQTFDMAIAGSNNNNPSTIVGTESKACQKNTRDSSVDSRFPWKSSGSIKNPTAVAVVEFKETSPHQEEEEEDEDNQTELTVVNESDAEKDEGEEGESNIQNEDIGNDEEETVTTRIEDSVKEDKDESDTRIDDRISEEKSRKKAVVSDNRATDEQLQQDKGDSNNRAGTSSKKEPDSSKVKTKERLTLSDVVPYMRMFVGPQIDEALIDTVHVMLLDDGCELCPERKEAIEAEKRVVERRKKNRERNNQNEQSDEEEDDT